MKRHKSIHSIFPNTDTTTIEEKEIKQLIDLYPNKWSQILLTKKYSKLLKYINAKTPLLSNSEYTLVTKCYWIFNKLTDFPLCKVDNKPIYKNVRQFDYPCYDTCCKRCGQIYAGWKRVKRNNYDYSQIDNAKKQKKYLQSIIESKDSNFKTEYFELITKYKNNPIQHININQCINSPTLYSEKHHINPKWYYITNNLQVDNSDNNLVRVSFEDHVKLHILLVKHFKAINDKPNYYKSLCACKAFCRVLNLADDIYKINVNDLEQLKIYKILADAEFAKKHSGKNCHLFKWDKATLQLMLTDYVLSNYDLAILTKKYNYTSTHDNFRALLRRNNISYTLPFNISKKCSKCLPTYEQYIEYKTYYNSFGFAEFVKKYNYPSSKRTLLVLFNKCQNAYKYK